MRTTDLQSLAQPTQPMLATLTTTNDTLTVQLPGAQPLTVQLPRGMGNVQLQRRR